MSIWTTIFEDGIKATITKIPSLYLGGAVLVLLAGVFIYGKIWFHNKVEEAAQKEISAYIALNAKDANQLTEINVGDNKRIVIQYQDRVKVITKIVKTNDNLIIQKVLRYR